jgi:hypothetical protein
MRNPKGSIISQNLDATTLMRLARRSFSAAINPFQEIDRPK